MYLIPPPEKAQKLSRHNGKAPTDSTSNEEICSGVLPDKLGPYSPGGKSCEKELKTRPSEPETLDPNPYTLEP